jgi:hypothetical protein
MKVTEALVEQRHCFELLIRKIDDLVAALSTGTFKVKDGKVNFKPHEELNKKCLLSP